MPDDPWLPGFNFYGSRATTRNAGDLLARAAIRVEEAWLRHWLKVKNPAAPAVRREAEEDWGR
jgi:hypothetical protein